MFWGVGWEDAPLSSHPNAILQGIAAKGVEGSATTGLTHELLAQQSMSESAMTISDAGWMASMLINTGFVLGWVHFTYHPAATTQ
jgi:hypothetical protein